MARCYTICHSKRIIKHPDTSGMLIVLPSIFQDIRPKAWITFFRFFNHSQVQVFQEGSC